MGSDPEDGAKVVFVSGVRGDTRRYRSAHPYEQLRLHGIPAALSHVTDPNLPALIADARAVVFHRVACDGYITRLIDRARSTGALILFDADDLTFDQSAFQWIDSPDFQDPIRAALYQEDMRRNQATLKLCDAATASTEFLAARIERLGIPSRVHRNAFSLKMLAAADLALSQKPPSGEHFVLGYASGTPTHNRDFASIRPALQEALRQHPQAELRLVGALDPGDGWEGAGERIRLFPLVPWEQLPQILAEINLNLAPLVADNPFAQSKSEIKFVESGLVEVPTIATPVEAFRQAISPGRNSFLASMPEEWSALIERCILDRELCRTLGAQARTDVLQNYHPSLRGTQLITILDQLSLGVRGKTLGLAEIDSQPHLGELDSHLTMLEDPSLRELAWYSFRHRGPGTLLRREWVYFRRLVSPLFPFKSVRESVKGG
ncbi:MAG TPA: glycosyltransferase [Anaerolineaceae bacterium]